METICINSFLNEASLPLSVAVGSALLAAKGSPAQISLEKAEYCVSERGTAQNFYYISNNDAGNKSILFHLKGCKDLVIDGNGSTLTFLGRTIAFAVVDAENITLRNFTIRQKRPLFTQGKILDVGEKWVEIFIDREKYPYSVVGETLHFWGDEWESDFLYNFLEYDETGYTAYNAGDAHSLAIGCRARQKEDGALRLSFQHSHHFRVGNTLVIEHEKRIAPGIFIHNSKNITLENICIEGSSGMAMIAQHSENISVDHCVVAPKEGSGNCVSACADATHFVNCKGKIRLNGCTFCAQMDDGTNVHGIYTVVERALASDIFLLRLGHYQQFGQVYIHPGDSIEFCNSTTLHPQGVGVAASCVLLDEQHLLLKTEQPLAFDPTGCGVENTSTRPEVEIRGCHIFKNRARSILLSARGSILVEGNTFSSGGAAVHISGDTNFWFESGRVEDVRIIGNTFRNCRRFADGWGKAVINIIPEVLETVEGTYFHKNISIEKNTFVMCDTAAIWCENTDGLRVAENTFELTEDYPIRSVDFPQIMIKNTTIIE